MYYKIFFTFFTIILTLFFILKKYKRSKLKKIANKFFGKHDLKWKPERREKIIENLKTLNFDVLIIGGGATGTGCAIEAVTRGLSVGLIEANDFAYGTSAKSTKLLHGGIRYLEKALNNIDCSQFKLVTEALNERKIVMDICPFLSRSVDIIFPIYKKVLIPYYYILLKIYDWISGHKSLGKSRFLSKEQTMKRFPNIRKKNLVGSISYFDGQFYDSKFNVILAITAAYYGATVLNHTKLVLILKNNGKISGIKCLDKVTNKEFEIKCKVLVNTTGPFTDNIRAISDQRKESLLQQSYGTHIVVPTIFSPKNMGFVDPNTSDGRIAFFMNYKGKTLIGSTDVKCGTIEHIKPTKEDLNFLIHEANYFTENDLKLTKKDVLAVWTGIRPLVKDTTKSITENVVRKHIINIDDDNLVTVTGGKWTIFRLMSEQAIEKIIKTFNIPFSRPSITKYFKILGSQGYTKSTEIDLALKLCVPKDIAKHLSTSYGTKAYIFAKYFNGSYTRLTDGYPYTKEEILYCIEHEMTYKVSDILFSRLMIGYIDVKRAFELIEIVLEVMGEYFGWDKLRYKEERKNCKKLMETCGYRLLK